MHPAFAAWLSGTRGGPCGSRGFGGGPPAWFGGHWGHHGGGGHHDHGGGGGDFDGLGGGHFGIRRPLRFLAHKLELDESQMGELATILDELKIERAQASVDHRRSSSALADAMVDETLDAGKIEQIQQDRVKSAERLQASVVRALSKIHGLLSPEQRKKFAYLLRMGALAI